MEHKALSALIIRIAGLLVLVYSIVDAAGYLVPYLYPRSTEVFEIWPIVLNLFVTIVLPLFLGLLLVCFPHSITNHVLKVEGTAVGADGVKPLQRVAFSAIGLWLTLYAVIDATYFYARSRLYLEFFEEQPSYSGHSPLTPEDFGGFVSSAVQFVIGISLLIGSRGFVNLLARIRS